MINGVNRIVVSKVLNSFGAPLDGCPVEMYVQTGRIFFEKSQIQAGNWREK
jgi:hypothetical protein